MPFTYAESPHVRKHGPSGYAAYQSYKDWLRDEFAFRCVYCLERERWYPNGHASFGVDHVKPKGNPEYEHLVCEYSNLVYACNRCNSAKDSLVLIDPCATPFAQHLLVQEDGEIEALTDEGRDLINYLGLDLIGPTRVRLAKIRILKLYRRYPNDQEVRELYLDAFGFPLDLPDLAAHTRAENDRPGSVKLSYYALRGEGKLPQVYEADY
jgi:hypothetical protein